MKSSSKNYSASLFKQMEIVEKKRVSARAATVVDSLAGAERLVAEAQSALKKAEKRAAKMQKALKKFKKTGDIKYLEIFGG